MGVIHKEPFIELNVSLLHDTIKEHLRVATNRQELQELIKESFSIDYCKIDTKEQIIQVMDITLRFKDIELQESDFDAIQSKIRKQ